MSEPRFDVVGISKATVDVITSVDIVSLNIHGIAKGGMTLIYVFRAKQLEDAISSTIIIHGGSAPTRSQTKKFQKPLARKLKDVMETLETPATLRGKKACYRRFGQVSWAASSSELAITSRPRQEAQPTRALSGRDGAGCALESTGRSG